MGPRKAPSVENMEDFKSIEFLHEEVSAIRIQQKSILEFMEEVKALRFLNIEKEKRIAFLEDRVAELEQYTYIKDFIVTGPHTNPRSYARAVSGGGEEHSEEAAHSIKQPLTTFLHSKGIKVNNNNVESCHNLQRKNKTG